ncbi:hypothetical protein G3M48_004639 [Beauveria asiatica]|uniref:F-box domain-containing protein n=1 Tax=Beauveria asiatica TaxID=1069075 RepID=A0AAW0RTZ7_9HYPO
MAHMTVVERISTLPEELRLGIFGRCSLGELMILANVDQKANELVKSRMKKLCHHVPGELHDLDQTSLRTLSYICADTTENLIVLLPEARCLSEKYDPKPFHAADLQWKTLTSVMAKMTFFAVDEISRNADCDALVQRASSQTPSNLGHG